MVLLYYSFLRLLVLTWIGVLLQLLLLFQSVIIIHASDISITTPISNFHESWTASSIHGTALALPFLRRKYDNDNESGKNEVNDNNNDKEAVMILLRYRKNKKLSIVSRSNEEKTTTSIEFDDGIRLINPVLQSLDDTVMFNDDDDDSLSNNILSNHNNQQQQQQQQQQQRWIILGTTAICTMTGFAPDIDYLTHVLQHQVDIYRYVYEGCGTTYNVPIDKLITTLSNILINNCLYNNERPYGIQALLIGIDRKRYHNRLKIYSFDPSGGYIHWNYGTSIGKYSYIIKTNLVKQLKNYNDNSNNNNERSNIKNKINIICRPKGAINALEISIRSCIQVTKQDYEKEMDDYYYEVVIVWENNNELCVGCVDPIQIDEIRQRILKEEEK